ncbi:hypothetical protein [Streptomyces sp. NPDC049040]|uniref:hypothetical protein n=1 Tax=Streptomyces sp. NPDC049040 TaxID=3365593 RepID=UPI00370FFC13
MRALQDIPAVPSLTTGLPAPGRRLHPGAGPRSRSARRLRCVIGVIGGVLWWGAVLRLAIRPEAAGPWRSAVAAGGWSLGLIPLHAVPARIRRPRTALADEGDAPAV